MLETSSPFQRTLVDGLAAMAPAGSPARTAQGRASLGELTEAARAHLLDHVMPFWDPRVRDPDHSGLLHYFDREGRPTGDDKSTWCQGRMAYTFSLLSLELGDRGDGAGGGWRAAADTARRFVVDHAYAGKGRWHYLCDRAGKVKDDRGSAFSDAFALMGFVHPCGGER